jgi:hypothetical protein
MECSGRIADALPYRRAGHQQLRGNRPDEWHREVTTADGVQITPFGRLRGDVYANNNLPDDKGRFPTTMTEQAAGGAGTSASSPPASICVAVRARRSPRPADRDAVVQVIAASDELDRDRIGNEDAITLDFLRRACFLQAASRLDRFEGGTRVNAGMLYTLLFRRRLRPRERRRELSCRGCQQLPGRFPVSRTPHRYRQCAGAAAFRRTSGSPPRRGSTTRHSMFNAMERA